MRHVGLTVSFEERWREEALVHLRWKGNHTNHVVGVKVQTAERLTAQLLYMKTLTNKRSTVKLEGNDERQSSEEMK